MTFSCTTTSLLYTKTLLNMNAYYSTLPDIDFKCPAIGDYKKYSVCVELIRSMFACSSVHAVKLPLVNCLCWFYNVVKRLVQKRGVEKVGC